MNPGLTVVLPLYNHAEHVSGMLDSILAQTHQADEIIIIEDASTDDSLKVVRRYAAQFNFIKIIENDVNKGVVHAMNQGLEAAKGTYIVFLAADDLVFPSFFEKSVRLLSAYEDAAFCTADTLLFEESLGSRKTSFLNLSSEPRYLSPEDLCRVLAGRHFYGPSTLLRTELVRKVRGFIPELKWHCDWFLFLALAFRYGICFLPEPMSQFRVRASYSSKMHGVVEQEPVNIKILELLRGSFQNLMPYFMKSGATDVLGSSMAETVFNHPEYWSPEINLLIQRNLWHWNKKFNKNRQDRTIKNRINKVLDEKEAWVRSHKLTGDIVVYGAGKHTEHLVTSWMNRDLPPIKSIIVSGVPRAERFQGIPIQSINDMASSNPGLVVVSSKSYEHEMLERTKKEFPKTSCLSFWSVPSLDT